MYADHAKQIFGWLLLQTSHFQQNAASSDIAMQLSHVYPMFPNETIKILYSKTRIVINMKILYYTHEHKRMGNITKTNMSFQDLPFFRDQTQLKSHSKSRSWSRGHKARGQGQAQGHKKIRGQGQSQGQPFRGQTLSRSRAGMLEAKDQRTQAQVLSKKKRSSQNFPGDLQKKTSSKKFFKRSTKF